MGCLDFLHEQVGLGTACAEVGGEHPLDGKETHIAGGHGERLKHDRPGSGRAGGGDGKLHGHQDEGRQEGGGHGHTGEMGCHKAGDHHVDREFEAQNTFGQAKTEFGAFSDQFSIIIQDVYSLLGKLCDDVIPKPRRAQRFDAVQNSGVFPYYLSAVCRF